MNMPDTPHQKDFTVPQSDHMLRTLAAIPEKSQMELGITLNVSGLLITGYMISQATYFNNLIDGLNASNADSEAKVLLVDFLSQLRDKLEDERLNKRTHPFPEFIHLRDTTLYPSEGQGMPSYGEALWRGRIQSVDGFSLGEMVPAPKKHFTQAHQSI
jgi:hypothetical protein